MATVKFYTDLEQSRKLAEILPLESADMHSEAVDDEGDMVFIIVGGLGDKTKSNYGSPVWSLAALLSVLPRIEDLKPVLDLELNCIQYPSDIDLSATADNPVDACVAMIERLNELKLL